jgi:hypothetical protein
MQIASAPKNTAQWPVATKPGHEVVFKAYGEQGRGFYQLPATTPAPVAEATVPAVEPQGVSGVETPCEHDYRMEKATDQPKCAICGHVLTSYPGGEILRRFCIAPSPAEIALENYIAGNGPSAWTIPAPIKSEQNTMPPMPPAGMEFQKGYGAEIPAAFHRWEWNCTFGRWSGLVTFADGWHGFSYPDTAPAPQSITPPPVKTPNETAPAKPGYKLVADFGQVVQVESVSADMPIASARTVRADGSLDDCPITISTEADRVKPLPPMLPEPEKPFVIAPAAAPEPEPVQAVPVESWQSDSFTPPVKNGQILTPAKNARLRVQLPSLVEQVLADYIAAMGAPQNYLCQISAAA